MPTNSTPSGAAAPAPFSLRGKSVLITGAAGVGVGSGVCEAVAEAGGRPIIGSRKRAAAEKACQRYPRAVPVEGDVAVEADVESIFAQAEAACGRVDFLVNNAGIGLSKLSADATSEEFDRLHNVDFRGLWMMSRRYVKACLAEGRPGAIVNVSSVHAQATMNRYAIYAGIKAGVEGLTRGMAVEYGAKGIRCNALAPGYVHAEQNYELIATWSDDPEGWVREYCREQQSIPTEISAIDCGRAAVFLLSDAARCVTGQTLLVDNGMIPLLCNRSSVE